MSGKSIDYGRGVTNIDLKTGIRYGIISQNGGILQAWADSSEPECSFGCPECGHNGGNKPWTLDTLPLACECGYLADDDSDWCAEEPDGFTFTDKEHTAFQNADSPYIWVTRSPYYTKVRLCSPCMPGAGDLDTPDDEYGERAYCFGHDWFEGGEAPYPVYSVRTGQRIGTKDGAV